MAEEIERLLEDVDAWAGRNGVASLDCYLLGGGALRLLYPGARRTKDLDVVAEPLGEYRVVLREVFGRDSGRDPYLDVVTGGLPILAQGWRSRAVVREGPWNQLRVWCLAPVDQIASKLKAFRPHDRRDIQLVCDVHPYLDGVAGEL